MLRIAFEGVDGSGKTTALFGYHEDKDPEGEGAGGEGPGAGEFVPGVCQRLGASSAYRVRPTREPGSLTYSESVTPAWHTTPTMQIEPHLNEAPFWTGMARHQVNGWSKGPESEGPEPGTAFFAAKSAIVASEFMRRHRALPSSIKGCLLHPSSATWPAALGEELLQIQQDHEEAYDFVHSDPALRRKFSTYDARDCLRHALVAAADSDEFPPVAKGLLFFASHVFNNHRLEQKLGGRTIALFDRTSESQRAYGRARGGNGFVERLYEKHGTDPDLVVLLTVEPGEGLRRQDGPDTDWETLETLKAAQEAYLERMQETGFDWIHVNTGPRGPEPTIALATDKILGWMAETRPMPEAEPSAAFTS